MRSVATDFEKLRELFGTAELEQRADGSALVRIPDFRVPRGWNTSTTTVVFLIPVGYPVARLDSFWTDGALRLASGALPTNTGHNTNYGGAAPLLWFSYHPSQWNPQTDDLITYVNVIKSRLREPR